MYGYGHGDWIIYDLEGRGEGRSTIISHWAAKEDETAGSGLERFVQDSEYGRPFIKNYGIYFVSHSTNHPGALSGLYIWENNRAKSISLNELGSYILT